MTKNHAFALGVVMLAVLGGCVSVQPIPSTITTFDVPPLNVVTEKELGDTLIDKGIIKSYEAIVTTEPTVANWAIGATMRAEPGTFVARGKTEHEVIYGAPAPIYWTALIGSGLGSGGIVIPERPFEPYMFVTIGSGTRRSFALKNFRYKKTIAEQVLPGSFRQEFIYNGRAGSSVKFLYREIKDSYLRAPSTQDVTYDLGDGDVIGFKGARLKIIEASNTRIKYQVSKTFD